MCDIFNFACTLNAYLFVPFAQGDGAGQFEISHLGVNWSLTWYKVPGTRYLVPGTWYLVPYLVPATWYSVPGRVLGMMETLAGDVNLEGFLGSALKVFLT